MVFKFFKKNSNFQVHHSSPFAHTQQQNKDFQCQFSSNIPYLERHFLPNSISHQINPHYHQRMAPIQPQPLSPRFYHHNRQVHFQQQHLHQLHIQRIKQQQLQHYLAENRKALSREPMPENGADTTYVKKKNNVFGAGAGKCYDCILSNI